MNPSGWSTYRGFEKKTEQKLSKERLAATITYFSKKIAKGSQAQSRGDVPQS